MHLIEHKAVACYLSDWNPKASYDQIIDALRSSPREHGWIDAHDISVWYPFENEFLEKVADYIEQEFSSLTVIFNHLKEQS